MYVFFKLMINEANDGLFCVWIVYFIYTGQALLFYFNVCSTLAIITFCPTQSGVFLVFLETRVLFSSHLSLVLIPLRSCQFLQLSSGHSLLCRFCFLHFPFQSISHVSHILPLELVAWPNQVLLSQWNVLLLYFANFCPF